MEKITLFRSSLVLVLVVLLVIGGNEKARGQLLLYPPNVLNNTSTNPSLILDPNFVYEIELNDLWSDGSCYSDSYEITNLSDIDTANTTHYFYAKGSSTPWLTYQDPEVLPPSESKIYDLADFPSLDNFHGDLIVASTQPISGVILPFPPCDITITGPSEGAAGNEYTFTANVSPDDAALPITYTWTVTDFLPIVNSRGITDSIDLIWSSSGWKQVTVTAENSRGSKEVTALLFIGDQPRAFLPIIMDHPITDPPVITGNVIINDIFFDGAGSSEPNEYVEIQNVDKKRIQLKDWILHDIANHVFTFPDFVIQPNQTCRIYTNENHPEWCGFNYESGSAIWNNGGDTAYLRDANGTLIDDYSF